MKKISIIFVSLLLILGVIGPVAASTPEYVKMEPVEIETFTLGPKVQVDGNTVETVAVVKDGITYVPLTFFSMLGLMPMDINRTLVVNSHKNDDSVSFVTDWNGNIITYCKFKKPGQDKNFFLGDTGDNTHTYVQLCETVEFFGFSVIYDEGSNTVEIIRP